MAVIKWKIYIVMKHWAQLFSQASRNLPVPVSPAYLLRCPSSLQSELHHQGLHWAPLSGNYSSYESRTLLIFKIHLHLLVPSLDLEPDMSASDSTGTSERSKTARLEALKALKFPWKTRSTYLKLWSGLLRAWERRVLTRSERWDESKHGGHLFLYWNIGKLTEYYVILRHLRTTMRYLWQISVGASWNAHRISILK